jgi:hypothetical protein
MANAPAELDIGAPDAPQGHHVMNGDIVPFAKENCPTCGGAGEYARAKQERRGEKGPLIPVRGRMDWEAKLCMCAYKRFVRFHKKNSNLVFDAKGTLFWVAGTAGDRNSYAASLEKRVNT